MPDEEKPWWHDHHEKIREYMKMLIKTAPTYFEPPRDSGIIYKPRGNIIAVEDQSSGDCIKYVGQRSLSGLDFITKSDKLVCRFETECFGDKLVVDGIPLFAIAVSEIWYSKYEEAEVIEARKRISFKKLAEYMTAAPDFSDNPNRDMKFVIIDATGQCGEWLRGLREFR